MGSINSQVVVLETSHSGLGALAGGRLSSGAGSAVGSGGMKWINKADGLMRYRVEGEKGTPRALILVTWILKRLSLACILQNLWKPLGWTVRSICIQGWKSPYRIWTLYWAIQTALTQSLSKSIFFFFCCDAGGGSHPKSIHENQPTPQSTYSKDKERGHWGMIVFIPDNMYLCTCVHVHTHTHTYTHTHTI